MPCSRIGANAAASSSASDCRSTPTTRRSGSSASLTAKPSRVNSGLQARRTALARRRELDEPVAHALGGADRDRGLADDEAGAGEQRPEALDRGLDVGGVGCVGALELRGADAEEVDVAVLGGLGVGRGEAQPAGRERVGQQGVETGLVERRLAAPERVDLRRVDVEAEDVVTGHGHRGRVHGAEVAAADDGDAARAEGGRAGSGRRGHAASLGESAGRSPQATQPVRPTSSRPSLGAPPAAEARRDPGTTRG